MSLSTTSPFLGSDTMIINPPKGLYFNLPLSETTPFSEQPYMTSMNLSYSKPLVGMYENLNNDIRLHKKMTNYYRYKCIDDWLHDDLEYVLKMFKENKSKEQKMKILEEEILTKNKVYSILTSFTRNSKTNWYDLHKNEDFLKEAFSIVIRKLLKKHGY